MVDAAAASEADRALIAELTALGHDAVTPRQLRRWRAAHLIPTPSRLAAGRGLGRPSVAYPSGTVDRASLVAALVARGRPFRDVRFELLWRGERLPIDVVREDYGALFDKLAKPLPKTQDPNDAPYALVKQKYLRFTGRTPVGRAQAARAGIYGARRDSVVEDAHSSVAGLAYGVSSPDEINLPAVAHVYGVSPEHADFVADVGSRVTLPALRARIPTLAHADLDTARPIANDYAYVAQRAAKEPKNQEQYPGIVDIPAFDDPETKAFTLLNVLIVSEQIPEWAAAFTAEAEKLRKNP